MTAYSDDQLGNWEFKIVRSGTGLFGRPDKLREVLEEIQPPGVGLIVRTAGANASRTGGVRRGGLSCLPRPR